jgi:hypothetical protein
MMMTQEKVSFHPYHTVHRLNMELGLQRSLFWLRVHCCTLWLRSRNSPRPPRIWATRALLVSQDRRRLFVTPWSI